MKGGKLLLTCFLLLLVFSTIIGVYYYRQPIVLPKAYSLAVEDYMVYEQFFNWDGHNETKQMTWNVTQLENDVADLHLVSHGVNVTSGIVTIVTGEANWTINKLSREVLSSSDSNYIGKKWPFWISTDASLGSSVDIFYGVSMISGNEIIDVFGQKRDCWIVQYDWATSNMERWYDKLSGICLKILVTLHRQDITIMTTETAVLTNVELG